MTDEEENLYETLNRLISQKNDAFLDDLYDTLNSLVLQENYQLAWNTLKRYKKEISPDDFEKLERGLIKILKEKDEKK